MKVGFIGCGNMAGAIIGGIINKNILPREDLMASAVSEKTLCKIREELKITAYTDNKKLAEASDMIILSVKPFYLEKVIGEIRDAVTPDKVVVSIAAGKKLAWMEERFGKEVKRGRTMPNTPALVGEGVTGICHNGKVTEEELSRVCEIFRSFGKADMMTEQMIDVVGAVSGSSPAFAFMFIEAMADAAVAEGMPRAMAYEFAAQAVLGSAKMVLETGMHPGALKDMVCSPAGTTIEGVQALEEKGMRSAVMQAVRACVKKTREI